MSRRIVRGIPDPSWTRCDASFWSKNNRTLTTLTRLLARLPQIGLTILLLLTLHADTRAQQSTTSITDGTTPSGMAPGSPAGSYALSGFDNVNLFNGNLNFRLPLLGISGRGSAGYSMTLALNLKSWHVSHNHKILPDGSEVDSFKPVQTGWHPYGGYGPGQLSGRHYGLQTSTVFGGAQYYSTTLGRLTFSTADGTEYELRDQLTDGQPLQSTYTQGAYRGYVFVTADGSSATYISDTPVYDNPQINPNGPRGFAASALSGYLMLRDGTRYRIDGGSISWMLDRNGNKVSFSYDSNGLLTSVIDSLNRQINISYDVQDGSQYGLRDEITFNGFGGTLRVVRISKVNLENALRPGSGYSTKTLGGAAGLFPELNGASATTVYNPQVTSSIWLPDGIRRYKFYYNSYGELSRVELPTGGAIEYDMTPGSGVVCVGTSCSSPDEEPQIYRRVVERRVYSDGSTGTSFDNRINYTNSETIGVNTSTITEQQSSQNGTVLSRSRHFFDGSALDSLFVGAVSSPYGKWYEGHETQTEVLDTSGPIESATVLRRVINTWAQRTSVMWWAGYASTVGLPVAWEPPKDPRLIETVTTVEPNAANLVSKRTAINPQDPNSAGFDQYNNQTDSWEYDFGSGTPGAFIRRTHTDFITTSNYVNANVNPTLGAHLRSLPVQQWISSSMDGSTKASLTVYEYDNYADNARHKPLVPRTGITSHDAAYSTSFTVRGNLTGVTSYANATAQTGPVTSSRQYDIAGNVGASIDAREKTTTVSYADSFCNGTTCGGSFSQNSYAFPATITSPVPDPTGQQGSASALVNSSVYDFWTGHTYSTTDANGQITSFRYTDLLDRPTQVIRAEGTGVTNQTTFQYDDANRVITTTSDLNVNNDNLLVTKVLYDGLGRTTETQQYEGGGNYVATQQQYDGMGRTSKVSNPFRPLAPYNETPIWTESTFDSLGRIKQVKTPDNALVTTYYDGVRVLVKDQVGNERMSKTNALGQLMDMWEVRSADSATDAISFPGHTEVTAGYYTSYAYDLLDDLTNVTQGTQPLRTFAYDSLKRLTSASNPESGTISYQYDNNGNLTQKTDARLIVTTYAYDALNRNTSVTYTNDPAGTPGVVRTYDQAPNGKGRLWQTQMTGTGDSVTAIDSYDALGRPLIQHQELTYVVGNHLAVKSYSVQRTYDLAGHVLTQTYPSGHTVNYAYDSAGRTSSFAGNLGDNKLRNYSTEIIYSAMGAITKEKFGTDTPIYNKLFYNSRGQLAEIRESTSYTGPNDTDFNRGAIINFYSTCWGSCGGSNSTTPMTDNNGNLRRQEVYIYRPNLIDYDYFAQSYDYDSLNRLQYVSEKLNGTGNDTFKQAYTYDRWGNRTIDQVNTTPNVPHPGYTVDPGNNNRLLAPAGYVHLYDAAGNQTKDTYTTNNSAGGQRTYDAENRMVTAQQFPSGKQGTTWAYYTYNGDGQRVRRKVYGVETWSVYGMDGELVAEYPQQVAAGSPQKEYGYRNGQLLVIGQPYAGNANAQWLVTDQLGTPRMIFDKTGSVAGVSRHDYLPFGEEILAGTGGRTMTQGYTAADGVRQKFTRKERDTETGLDYFGARYYSSIQGRFTGADLAGSVVVNPQTLNKYTYALNNPLRHTDSNGLYEDDVHRDLTVALAYAVGFSMKDAMIIGREDQRIDDDSKTSPFAGVEARALWHFTTPGRRDELWSMFEWSATTEQNEYAYWGALQRLGGYFHAEQDSFAHEGFGPILGHALAGHAPDQTFNDVPKADRMARDTFDRLVEAINDFSKRFGGQVSNYRIPWNDTIADYVHQFNAARERSQKAAILAQLIMYVDQQRSRAKWEEDFEKENGPPPKMPKKKK